MDYEVSWLIENEVVHVLQLQEWTLEVGAQMVREVNMLMESAPKAKVPIVIDVRRVPGHFYNLLEAHRMFKATRSPKWGFTCLLTTADFFKFMAKAILIAARIDFQFVTTLDEAQRVLYRHDPTLADKPLSLLASMTNDDHTLDGG